MKKFFLFLFIIIILIAAALFIYVNVNGASMISSFLTKQLKTPVTVESASLGFNEINLYGFKMANPTTGSFPDNFKAERIELRFDSSTLFKDTLNIRSITLYKPTIYIELLNLTGTDNNWKAFFNRLSESDEPSSTEEKTPSKINKELIIDTLIIENLDIQAQHVLLGPYTLNLPIKEHIVFHELTKKKALAYQAALTVIFKSLLESIANFKGFKEIFKEIQFSPTISQDILENITAQAPKEEPAKKIISKANDTWDEIKEEVQEAPKKIKEFFNKIFK